MKSLVLLSLALVPVLIPVAARAADPARLADAQRRVERGVYARTVDGMVQARAELERLATAEPKSAALHYWVAYADWRIAARLTDKKPQATRYVKDGLEHARKAFALNPHDAESLALESSLLGISLQIEPANMMTIGPQIETEMRRALEMAPENPRVLLLDAIGTLHKPAFVGGGADKALPKFQKAQERFAAEDTADSTAAHWGRFESYAWAGRSALKLGDRDAARGYYQRALDLQPDNGWVKGVLLPELDAAPDTSGTKSGS